MNESEKRFIVVCGDREDDQRSFDTEDQVFKYLKDEAADDHEHTVFENKVRAKLFTAKARKVYFDE